VRWNRCTASSRDPIVMLSMYIAVFGKPLSTCLYIVETSAMRFLNRTAFCSIQTARRVSLLRFSEWTLPVSGSGGKLL